MNKKVKILVLVILIGISLIIGSLFYVTRTEYTMYLESEDGDNYHEYYKNELFGVSACDLGIGSVKLVYDGGDLYYTPPKNYCVKTHSGLF